MKRTLLTLTAIALTLSVMAQSKPDISATIDERNTFYLFRGYLKPIVIEDENAKHVAVVYNKNGKTYIAVDKSVKIVHLSKSIFKKL